MNNTQSSDVKKVEELSRQYNDIKRVVSQVIVGQDEVVNKLIISILCNGHSLLVGVPGLAKTLLVNTVADVMDLSFKRIQFTPDLMPSDITGTEILDEHRHFKFMQGPIFANIVLADEINRTPPKTQAALLEAMQEKHITNSGIVYQLPKPFFVLATQNPIEQEGTYPLPEAQLDRFMFKIDVTYPSFQEEVDIVKATTSEKKIQLQKVITAEEIISYQELIRRVPVSDNVYEYAVRLVQNTRPQPKRNTTIADKYFAWGAGPRASQNLIMAGKCHALLNGKYSPDIEDIDACAFDVLQHRIFKNYKAESDGRQLDDLIAELQQISKK